MADDPKPDPKDPENKPDPEDEPLDLERVKEALRKKNSEAVNLRKRLKEAEAAEEELQKLKDKDKSDAERAAEKTRSLEDKATQAETELLKLRVALRKGLSETQAKRLVGTTEEELESDADELLESFKPSEDGGKPKPSTKPKEDLKGGGDPTNEPEEMDPRKLAAAVPRL